MMLKKKKEKEREQALIVAISPARFSPMPPLCSLAREPIENSCSPMLAFGKGYQSWGKSLVYVYVITNPKAPSY
jgi:hypothetical protein